MLPYTVAKIEQNIQTGFRRYPRIYTTLQQLHQSYVVSKKFNIYQIVL